jgi:predicted lipoprotein with Yx(FWY)xxD motif
MRRTHSILISVLAAGALSTALVACSSPEGDDDPEATEDQTMEETTTDPAEDETDDAGAMGDVDLAIAETSLGEVIVDGTGLTAYYFSNDVADSGTSACEGECLVNWPPITTESETPTVEGVTAEVGTITAADGSLQVTVDGRPIYLFVGDAAPGDVNGQGVQDVWWVIAPDGSEIND